MKMMASKSHKNMLSQLVGDQPVVMTPNTLDNIGFRKELGNVLAKCYHNNHDQNVGFPFLIDKEKVYLNRSGEENLPCKLGKPVAPTGNMLQTAVWKMHEDQLKHCKMYIELDSAAGAIIHHKFPKIFMYKVEKRSNTLLAKMTAQQAYNHIEGQHTGAPEQQVLDRVWTMALTAQVEALQDIVYPMFNATSTITAPSNSGA
eukprot:jgi/Psemu1/289345/fgenesh1_pg.348_\